jgi:hypothetical protein
MANPKYLIINEFAGICPILGVNFKKDICTNLLEPSGAKTDIKIRPYYM